MNKAIGIILVFFLFSCNPEKTETPVTISDGNPLLHKGNDPIAFSDLRNQHIKEILAYTKEETNKTFSAIYGIPQQDRTFANTMKAIDHGSANFYRVFYLMSLLSAVHPDSEIKNSANEALFELNEMSNAILLSDELYEAMTEYNLTNESKELPPHEKRFLSESLRAFRLNGLGLPSALRKRMRELNDSIDHVGTKFLFNIYDSGEEIELQADELKGLSESFIASLRKEETSYYMPLTNNSYFNYLRDAESEAGRKKVYIRFSNTKVEENLSLLNDMLRMRQELAQLLGFENYAAYTLSTKVLDKPQKVWQFLEHLDESSKSIARDDYAELVEVKEQVSMREQTGEIKSWNRLYYQNILLKTKYNVDMAEISQYYEVYAVVRGIIDTMEELFDVEIEQIKFPSVWHQDVMMFEIKENGELKSRFYLDLFSRDNKASGEFASPITFSEKIDGEQMIPSMALITGFVPPTKQLPTVLTHTEVVSLFNVFGFMLSHNFCETELFSQNSFLSESDFSYAPGSVFGNFAWEYDVIKKFARHYKSGKLLPEEDFKRLKTTKNVGAGTETNNQVLFSAIDLTLHSRYNATSSSIPDLVAELENEISLFPHVQGTHLETSFSHLYEYGGNYYMYLLSDVYASDMYAVFKKNGILSKEVGKQLKNKVLKKGISEDEYNAVVDFLNREPSDSAYIKSLISPN